MNSVIVLTQRSEYWQEVSWQRVVSWLAKGKVRVLVEDESKEIRTVSVSIKMPVVVMLLNFLGYKSKTDRTQYSDQAVYDRDGSVCQYWHYDEDGNRFKYVCDANERTIDHVTPKDQGGRKSFENCVCACEWHNTRVKKNRTPEQAGLELIRKPRAPRKRKGEWVTVRFVYNPSKPSHKLYFEKWLSRTFDHRE